MSDKENHIQDKKNAAQGKNQWLSSIAFLLILTTLSVLSWIPALRDTVSIQEKRELAEFPDFSWTALSGGSYFDQVTLWFADSFPWRDTWMAAGDALESCYGHTDILLTGSGAVTASSTNSESQPQLVIEPTRIPTSENTETVPTLVETNPPKETVSVETVQSETVPAETNEAIEETIPEPSRSVEEIMAGMEYYADGTAIVMDGAVYPAPTFNECQLDCYAEKMSKAAELLDGKAKVYVVTPLRSTSSKLDRFMREYFGFPLDEDVLAYLEEKLDDRATLVDSLTVLQEHRDEYTYFYSDHHWTALGAYYVYTDWAKKAGVEAVSLSDYQEDVQEGFPGSLSGSGTRTNPVKLDDVHTFLPPGDIQLFLMDDDYDSPGQYGFEQSVITVMSTEDKYCAFLAGDHALSTFVNNDIGDESACLIVKDSNGNCFSYYFTQHYKYVFVVDYRYYWNRSLTNFVDTYNIQDVIFCTSMFLAQSTGGNSLLEYFIR